MSLMYIAEIGVSLPYARVREIFQSFEVIVNREDGDGFCGNFKASHMSFSCLKLIKPSPPKADFNNAYGDLVGNEIVFSFGGSNFEQSKSQIRALLESVRAEKAFFVFSFQYEAVYSFNDRDGCHVVRVF